MVTVHALIGIGEALITGFVVSLIFRQRPDLIHSAAQPTAVTETGRFLAAGLVCSLAVAAFLSPLASGLPDGLDSVAQHFSITASEDSVTGLFGDYDGIPIPGWQTLSVSIAGIGGALIVFAAAILLGRVLPQQPAQAHVAEASGE